MIEKVLCGQLWVTGRGLHQQVIGSLFSCASVSISYLYFRAVGNSQFEAGEKLIEITDWKEVWVLLQNLGNFMRRKDFSPM